MHEEVVGSRKSQWTTNLSQNLGTYIVYNAHVTCSNSCFSLVMVMPMPHFFVFHWLQFLSMSCLFPIGYLSKPTFMGGLICHHLLSSTMSIGQGDIPIITLLILSSARQSCQQHLLCSTPAGHGDILVITLLILSLVDEAVNNNSWYNNTCRAWWHSCNNFNLNNVSVNNIHCVQHLQVMLIYYTSTPSLFLLFGSLWPTVEILVRFHLWVK